MYKMPYQTGLGRKSLNASSLNVFGYLECRGLLFQCHIHLAYSRFMGNLNHYSYYSGASACCSNLKVKKGILYSGI